MAIDDNTSYELTGYQVKDLASKVRGKADSSSLASVATSGLYSDLTGKPTIPTVNNGTLTIKQNGTTVDTFSANQSTNVTVDLAGGIYADDPTAPANPNAWVTSSDIDWTTVGVTTTTSDGWKKTTLGPNITIYSKTYTTSGSISGTGQGNTGCFITPPSDFSTADDEDVIGESFRDSVAEIYYRRIDSLQRSGGCRIYGVSIYGSRTMNGKYTITLMKRS